MHWVRRILWRLEVLFRKDRAEGELDEELRHHLESEIRENLRGGMAPAEARRRAMADFGGVERTKEQVRNVRGARGLDDLSQDVRYALRRLAKSPGFTSAAVLTLAVGIGATVAMFSVLEGALVSAFSFQERQELVLGRATFAGRINPSMSYLDYLDFAAGTDGFSSAGLIRGGTQEHTVTGGGEAERVTGQWISVEVLPTLDVEPVVGRAFLPEEGRAGGPMAILVSYGFWQSRLGGVEGRIGEPIHLDGSPVTVAGVLPPNFRIGPEADLWLPIRPGVMDTETRDSHSWLMVARLAPASTLAEAQAQVDVIGAQLSQAYPDTHANKALLLTRLDEALAEGYRPALLVLMGATVVILLIACGNVANLLLARGTTRTGELAVRAALGASDGRIGRQLFTESVVLGLGSGVLGTMLAFWFQRIVFLYLPVEDLGIHEIHLSGSMLLVALGLSLGTTILFGLGPAITGANTDPAKELTQGRRSSSGRKSARVRQGLVVLQVALSFVLLVGSGLMVRSFARLLSEDLGFRADHLLTADIQTPPSEYPPGPERTRFFLELQDEIEAVAGVRGVSFVNMLPIRHQRMNWGVWVPGSPPMNEAEGISAWSRTVLPGYFDVVGMSMVAGRDYRGDDNDLNSTAVVINQSLAEALYPGENPIGRHLASGSPSDPWDLEIIGVVNDARINLVAEVPGNQMYFHHALLPYSTMELVVRSQANPAALTEPLREILRSKDPDIPLAHVATMEEILSQSLLLNRVVTVMTGLFAAVSVLLSLLGLYGVLAFYVHRRTHELGVRIAMGAGSGAILRLVAWRGLLLVGVGLATGLAGAMGVTRFLRSFLYQVEPTDPVTFAGVVVVFLIVGSVACLLPGWRAIGLDPVRAIQSE